MAVYWADFEGYTVGDDPTVDGPAEFSNPYATPGSIAVADITGLSPPSGFTKALRFGYTGGHRVAYLLDAMAADPDRATVKIAVLAMCPNISGGGPQTYIGGIGRAGGPDDANMDGALGSMCRLGGRADVYLIDYVDGVGTIYDGNPNSDKWTAGDWYWVVTTLDGTTATVELYAANDGGGTVLASHTDTVGPTSAGGAGIWTFRPDNGGGPYAAAVEIATGSDSLTYAPPASDTTAPILSSPATSNVTANSVDASVVTDEGNGLLDAVVTTSSTAPSAAQIQAGQDHTGSAAAASDLNNTVASAGTINVSFGGLANGTTYYVHFVHQDAAGNDSAVVSSASFTTDAVDTTAPNIANLTVLNIAAPAADLQVFTDEGNGTIYFVVTTSSTQPSIAQIKAGQDHTGAGATASTTHTATSSGSKTEGITGLAAGTAYWAYAVHTDAAGNDSNVLQYSFSTPASTIKGVTIDLSTSTPADTTGIVWHVFDIATGASLASGTAETITSDILEIDLDAVVPISLSDEVIVAALKVDGTDVKDSLGHIGVHTVVDIS